MYNLNNGHHIKYQDIDIVMINFFQLLNNLKRNHYYAANSITNI